MILDLIDDRLVSGRLQRRLEVLAQVVGDTNRLGAAVVLESLDLGPFLLELLG